MASGDKRREFVITELRQTSNGKFTELPAKFVWTHDTQSAPRNSWEYAVKLRTVREDYTGGNLTTEQVLGWSFDPFTLEGVWDDRYAGENFAENTRVAMEQLVSRGNVVRLEFENISVVGLITKLTVRYKRKWQVGYAIEVSPHRREKDEARTMAPRAVANPSNYQAQTQVIVNNLVEIHALAPISITVGDIWALVDAAVQSIEDKQALIDSIVSNRVLAVSEPGQQVVNSISRLANAFGALRDSAEDLLPLVANLPTNVSLFFESAVGNLTFESWARGLGASARALIVAADAAAQELASRVTPDALALYTPHAGESLYAISNLFYGTPNRWRDIYARNNLHSFTLTGTETLVIPTRAVV
jgi:hypothetical protein